MDMNVMRAKEEIAEAESDVGGTANQIEHLMLSVLVRSGSSDPLRGRLLRANEEIMPDGTPVDPDGFSTYFIWDLERNLALPVSKNVADHDNKAALGDCRPALKGTFNMSIRGTSVDVTPLFLLLGLQSL